MLRRLRRNIDNIYAPYRRDSLLDIVTKLVGIAGFVLGLLTFIDARKLDVVSIAIESQNVVGQNGVYSIEKGQQITFRNTSSFKEKVSENGWIWGFENNRNPKINISNHDYFLLHDSILSRVGEYQISLEYIGNFKVDIPFDNVKLIIRDEKPSGEIYSSHTLPAVGDTVTFSVKNARAVSKTLWELDDGVTSEEFSPRRIFHKKGLHAITLTLYNQNGEETTLKKKIDVTLNPVTRPLGERFKIDFVSSVTAYYGHKNKNRTIQELESYFRKYSIRIECSSQSYHTIIEFVESLDSLNLSKLQPLDIKSLQIDRNKRKIEEIQL